MADDTVEILRREWPISRALKEFTTQKISGTEYATCPFCYHLQSTPKPTLHFDKIQWHCFRCKTGGDVFRLVQDIFGIDFVQAIRKMSGDKSVFGRFRRRYREESLRESAEFTSKDEMRERLDFIALDLMIQRCLKKECTLIRAMQRWGELTPEEADGEVIAAQGIADRLYEELDRVRCEMLYYLRQNIKKES